MGVLLLDLQVDGMGRGVGTNFMSLFSSGHLVRVKGTDTVTYCFVDNEGWGDTTRILLKEV